MRIRKATKKDLDGIFILSRELYMHQINCCKVDFNLRKDFKTVHKKDLSEKLKKRKNAFFVAEEGGKPIGFISGHMDQDPPIFLDRDKGRINAFYVQDEFRGKGIGRKLFAKMKEWFKKRNVKSMRLFVARCNPGAKRAYESLGFEPAQFEQLVLKM
jgi:ribosomal protein S18 acetylase RimI-like enzyme